MSEIVVGLDIGTHKICTIVGEVRADDIYVVGLGIEPSKGMKKGVVNDVMALSGAVSASIHKAERSSGFQIQRAFVSVAGGHIQSMTSRGMTGITGSRSVRQEDLDRALDAARTIAIPHNREILHVIPRSYTLDGQDGVRNPIGMHCFRLEVDAHIITAGSTSLSNIEQATASAGVEVDRFILNPLAAAEAVLTDQEREMGVVVIDIGGGTTDLAVLIEGAVWHTAVIPIGGNHVTNDLTYWMNVPFALAETVKLQHGSTLPRAVSQLETFLVEPFGDSPPREISRHQMAGVIEARIEEIFEEVRKEVKRSGYDQLLRAGAVLTGGASLLPGMQEIAARFLQCPVRIGKPERLTGTADALRSPAYATSVGLLRVGLNLESAVVAEDETPQGEPGFNVVMRAVSRLFRRLLPDEGSP